MQELLRAGDTASRRQAIYTNADASIPADMPRLVFSDLLNPAAKYQHTLGEINAEISKQEAEKGALTLSPLDQDQLREKTGLIRELTRQRNMLLTTIGVLSPRRISFTAEEMAEAKRLHEEEKAKTEEATRRYAETERQYAESARQQAERIRTQMTGTKAVPAGISPTTSHISWSTGEPVEIASPQARPAAARSKRSATVPGSDEPIIPQKQRVGRERVITVASGSRQSAARQAGSLGRESATFADNINQILEDRKKNATWSAQNPLHNFITKFHFNTFKNIINPSEAPSMPETEGVSPVTAEEFRSVANGIRDGVKLVAQGKHADGHAKILKVLSGKRSDGSTHKDWVRAVIGSRAMHPEAFATFYARNWGQDHISHLEDMKSTITRQVGEDDSLIRSIKPPKNFFAKTSFTTYKKSTYSELPHSSFEMSPFPFRIGWFRNR